MIAATCRRIVSRPRNDDDNDDCDNDNYDDDDDDDENLVTLESCSANLKAFAASAPPVYCPETNCFNRSQL